MANRFKIGELDVTVLSDGFARAPGTLYFQGTTAEMWEPHKRWLDHAGNVEFPFSCFLVRSGGRTVLIDTGLGQVNMFGFTGGDLLPELAAAGAQPEDIDTVFVTHLHVDHAGTVAIVEGESARPTFPNATYRWSADEHKYWTENLDSSFGTPDQKAYMKAMLAAVEGRVQTAEDGEPIAPGVNVIATPGHTPGHAAIVLSSGTERAFVLGDAISCPAQLTETEWSGMGDIDKALARRSQEVVAREAEATGALLAAAHFPGLTFGRVLRGEGKRYWEPVS
ncbi:MAG TPA: MBL fold metallo-hydrolase [Dehalococcoidia bacterium]|jgi:glyoxylase-like metal-dependent hydrolase (beta-lactamase superfamily II)|nr:MBL fold metallo-hydrolase [Dehalococcoidia bacterium]